MNRNNWQLSAHSVRTAKRTISISKVMADPQEGWKWPGQSEECISCMQTNLHWKFGSFFRKNLFIYFCWVHGVRFCLKLKRVCVWNSRFIPWRLENSLKCIVCERVRTVLLPSNNFESNWNRLLCVLLQFSSDTLLSRKSANLHSFKIHLESQLKMKFFFLI